MKKEEFLKELRLGLNALPETEIEERVSFYSDMIDDRIEEGMLEEQAIEEIGGVDKVLSEILVEVPLTKIVKRKMKPKRSLKGWEIALLIIGSPLWFPLLLAAIIVVLAIYLVVWALVIAFFACDIALSFGGLAAIVESGIQVGAGSEGGAIAMFGMALMCIGLSFFIFLGCVKLTQGLIKLLRRMIMRFKKNLARGK